MKKVMKSSDGKYHVDGHAYEKLVGSRAQVWHGTAYKTAYGREGLKKKNLLMNKHGHVVSRKKHDTAKKEKRLEKHGYFTQKGKFGAVKRSPKAHGTRKGMVRKTARRAYMGKRK